MKCRRPEKPKGFTLLEIVVSVAILGMMALMISYVFSASNRAVEQGKDQAILDESARLLLDYIEQDVSQTLIRTNVAFRIHALDVVDNNALYFVSTGMRRHLETSPRDLAPMRLEISNAGLLENQLMIRSPARRTVSHILRFSDVYYTSTNSSALDFEPVEGEKVLMSHDPVEYTKNSMEDFSEHAVLTSLKITVNGAADWGADNPEDKPPAPDTMPRFVDVSIGLAPASVIRLADTLIDAGNYEVVNEQIRKNERMYTRRIFMRNTGLDPSEF